MEGEATAVYIAKLIRDRHRQTDSHCFGVPVGGDLDYVDEVTMARAFVGRHSTHT